MTDAITHFNNLYRANPDPWNYTTSTYEARKYAATLAALTRPHYGRVIEAGCSIGVLSAMLAPRCDNLVALDFSEVAAAQAMERLGPFAGATARIATLPQDWPEGTCDLIMLSELIYYLTEAEVVTLARLVARDAAADAECVIVQYQGETGTVLTANAACELFCSTLVGLRKFTMIDHPANPDYTHRTLLFGRPAD